MINKMNFTAILDQYSLLFFSSFIFITNVITNYINKYYLYSTFFVFLTITSVIFHSNNNIYTNILDKIAILSIVVYGSYILYNKLNNEMNIGKYIHIFLIIITFILCIYLFFYGYCTNQYCYNPDKLIGDSYHCMIHFISSFGHHLITFL